MLCFYKADYTILSNNMFVIIHIIYQNHFIVNKEET